MKGSSKSRLGLDKRSTCTGLTLTSTDRQPCSYRPTGGFVPLSPIASSPRTAIGSSVLNTEWDNKDIFNASEENSSLSAIFPLPEWETTPNVLVKRSVTSISRKHLFHSSNTTTSSVIPPSNNSRPFLRSASEPNLSFSIDMIPDTPWARDQPWAGGPSRFTLALQNSFGDISQFSSGHSSSVSSRPPLSTEHFPIRPTASNRDIRLYYAIMELFTTELGYLSDLKAFSTAYLDYLPTLTAGGDPQVLLSSWEIDVMRRNAEELLRFHLEFVSKLKDIAQIFNISLDEEPKFSDEIEVDTIVSTVADLFISEAPRFAIYETFCARHQEALDIVRRIQQQHPLEWDAFERQCADRVVEMLGCYASSSAQSPFHAPAIISHRRSQSVASLEGIWRGYTPGVQMRPSRLTFLDYMIKPIQRICKYPLMLDQFSAGFHSKSLHRSNSALLVQNAARSMRLVASAVDEARHKSAIALQSSSILSRISVVLPVPRTSHLPSIHRELRQLTPSFISSLGCCTMSGPLDVYTPADCIESTVKSKYHGIFLYSGGYVIVTKVSKKVYDPRYWFRLESISDDVDNVTLPNAFRLTSGAFQLELAASSQAEKEAWVFAMRESLASHSPQWVNEPISSFQIHQKAEPPIVEDTSAYSLSGSTSSSQAMRAVTQPSAEYPALTEQLFAAFETDSRQRRKFDIGTRSESRPHSRRSSTASVRTIFSSMTSDSKSVVVQRPSLAARTQVDNGLQDVISESCLNARVSGIRDNETKSASASRSRWHSETVRISRSKILTEQESASGGSSVGKGLTMKPVASQNNDNGEHSLDGSPEPSPFSQCSFNAGSLETSSSSHCLYEATCNNPNPTQKTLGGSMSRSLMGNLKAIFIRESDSLGPSKSADRIPPKGERGIKGKKRILLLPRLS